MAESIYFTYKGSFIKDIIIRDCDDELNLIEHKIKVGVTTSNSGSPIFHIGYGSWDDALFKSEFSYMVEFKHLLEGALNYLKGDYSEKNQHLTYKQISSMLRHYAELVDLKGIEEETRSKRR